MTTLNGTPVSAPSAGVSSAIPRPSRARRRKMLTLADAVDHVLRVEDANPGQTRVIERAIMAVQSARRSFITYSTQGFKYYDARAHIVFNANVSLGQVVASSDVITPDSAPTWPSWMEFATIRVDNKTYQVLSYTSATATVSGLPDGTYTTATLQHSVVRLPTDFRRRGSLTDGSRVYPVMDTSTGILRSWEDYYEWTSSTGNPISFAAIAGDERFQGELLLTVWPPYASEKALSLHYERYMSELEYHRVGSGTVTTSGTSITASTSVFVDAHVGCSISFSTDNAEEIRSSLSSRDLVSDQRIITAVDSGTGATMDSAITGDISAKTYYISDVVDVMPGAMEEAFLRLCEYEFARASKSKTADKRFAEFRMQMDIAMSDDARYRDSIDDTACTGFGYGVGSVVGRPDL